jgi:hypothetical protein
LAEACFNEEIAEPFYSGGGAGRSDYRPAGQHLLPPKRMLDPGRLLTVRRNRLLQTFVPIDLHVEILIQKMSP